MKLWDWLNEITIKKSPVSQFSEEDWESWNSYMVHRFMSMGQNNIEVANIAQRMHPTDFECGSHEADHYIDIMGKDEVRNILVCIGKEKKEITKLFKS
jgi:hypothetical protein